MCHVSILACLPIPFKLSVDCLHKIEMITDPSGVHQLRAPGPGTAKFMTNVGLDEVVNLTLQGPERVEAQQVRLIHITADPVQAR